MTHRGQGLHVGARQTEVADHIQNPVVGCEVQRRSAVLENTKNPKRVLLTIVAEDSPAGSLHHGPALSEGSGIPPKTQEVWLPSPETRPLLREASPAERGKRVTWK